MVSYRAGWYAAKRLRPGADQARLSIRQSADYDLASLHRLGTCLKKRADGLSWGHILPSEDGSRSTEDGGSLMGKGQTCQQR